MLRRNLYLCNKLNLAIPGGPLDLCLGLWGMKLGLDDLLKKENGERTQTRWTVQCNSSISPRTAVLNMASHWKQLVLNELCSAWACSHWKSLPCQNYSCAGVWGACQVFFPATKDISRPSAFLGKHGAEYFKMAGTSPHRPTALLWLPRSISKAETEIRDWEKQ